VDVIRHQDVRVNLTSVAPTCRGEATEEDTIVGGPSENRHPIVAALNDVLRLAGEGKAWESSHGVAPADWFGTDHTSARSAFRHRSFADWPQRIQVHREFPGFARGG
jgi:hypothetical protein